MFSKLKNSIYIILGISVLLYISFLFISDYKDIIETLSNFNFTILLLVLCLVFVSFLLKFYRWHYYLNVVNIDVNLKESFLLYFSGLVMSISPGKWGEIAKSLYLKEKCNVNINKSNSVIVVERFIEFIALLVISIFGLTAINYEFTYLILPLLLVTVIFVLIKNRILSDRILIKIGKLPFLNKFSNSIIESLDYFRKLLKPIVFVKMFIISIIAWFIEFFGFYIILLSFTSDVSFIWASSVYSFAIIIGAISFIPGGLGVTEGSLVYLLQEGNFSNNYAIVITLIIRFSTLWFSVIVGVISLFFLLKVEKIIFNKIKFFDNR